MKIKTEYILLAVLVAALSGYLVWQRQKPTAYRLPRLPEVVRADIDRIRIERPGQAPIELRKTDGAWRVGDAAFAADSDKVNGMLEIIAGLNLTALVSEAGQYEPYNLNEGQRIRVQAWAGDRLERDFAVGKSASTYRHTFVTLAGDDRVYHAREDFRGRFDRDLDQLRDKGVMAFKRETIKTVRLTVGKSKPMEFSRVDPAPPEDGPKDAADSKTVPPRWQNDAGAPVDGQTLGNLVSNLASLECERYLYDRTKAEMETGTPEYVIELEGDRDRPYRLVLFAPLGAADDAQQRPGLSSENDDPFVVSSFYSRELSDQIAKLTGKTKDSASKDK